VILRNWKHLLRQHNKLRLELAQRRKVRDTKKAVKTFRRNPHDFAQKLFKGTSASPSPSFSKEEAEAFYHKTYQDADRGREYAPMAEQPVPAPPSVLFDLKPPGWKDILCSTKRKRNGAAPGLDALTYVLYKRCPAILKFAARLFDKVWRSREVPTSWALAFTILLAKSDNLSDPAEFRPITITCSLGNIFFSIVSARLQTSMIKNTYIPREVQKGFLTEVAGCLELVRALWIPA
jgi:hypothetical protein